MNTTHIRIRYAFNAFRKLEHESRDRSPHGTTPRGLNCVRMKSLDALSPRRAFALLTPKPPFDCYCSHVHTVRLSVCVHG